MNDQWIRRLNQILAEDVMHGIQFCDLSDQEQTEILAMRDVGMTPDEVIDSFMEGPL